jgi:hypothetical protein
MQWGKKKLSTKKSPIFIFSIFDFGAVIIYCATFLLMKKNCHIRVKKILNIILCQKCDISLMDNYGAVSLGVIICSIIIAHLAQKCAIIIFIIAHFVQKCTIMFSL